MRLNLKILSSRNVAIAGLAASLIAAAFLFGATGARTVASIVVFFFLPFYLIMRQMSLESDEKVFFAFFIGLGVFSTVVFYVGRVIQSFRISVAAAFILLLLLPLHRCIVRCSKTALLSWSK